MTDPTKSRRAVALRIAQRLYDEWGNHYMEGYDVDEATDLIEQLIPMSAAEAEAEMEAMRGDDDAPAVPVENPTLRAFKDALGVEKMPIIDCIKTATERLVSLRAQLAAVRAKLETVVKKIDGNSGTYYIDTDSQFDADEMLSEIYQLTQEQP